MLWKVLWKDQVFNQTIQTFLFQLMLALLFRDGDMVEQGGREETQEMENKKGGCYSTPPTQLLIWGPRSKHVLKIFEAYLKDTMQNFCTELCRTGQIAQFSDWFFSIHFTSRFSNKKVHLPGWGNIILHFRKHSFFLKQVCNSSTLSGRLGRKSNKSRSLLTCWHTGAHLNLICTLASTVLHSHHHICIWSHRFNSNVLVHFCLPSSLSQVFCVLHIQIIPDPQRSRETQVDKTNLLRSW